MLFNLIVWEFEDLQGIWECCLSSFSLSKIVNNFAIWICLFDIWIIEVDYGVSIRERFTLDTIIEYYFLLSTCVDSLDFTIMSNILINNFRVGCIFGMILFEVLETEIFIIILHVLLHIIVGVWLLIYILNNIFIGSLEWRVLWHINILILSILEHLFIEFRFILSIDYLTMGLILVIHTISKVIIILISIVVVIILVLVLHIISVLLVILILLWIILLEGVSLLLIHLLVLSKSIGSLRIVLRFSLSLFKNQSLLFHGT